MTVLRFFLILILFLTGTSAFSGDFYTWKNKNGETTISNIPPPADVKNFQKTYEDESRQTYAGMDTEMPRSKDLSEPPPPWYLPSHRSWWLFRAATVMSI